MGGDYFGLDSDGVVSIPPIVLSLVDLLDTKSIDWKEYMEDIPGPGFLGEGGSPANSKSGWLYVRKHKYATTIIILARLEVLFSLTSVLQLFDQFRLRVVQPDPPLQNRRV